MTVRKIEIGRLELRVGAGALKGQGRTVGALDALGRAVAGQLANQLAETKLEAHSQLKIDVTVRGAAAHPSGIAHAVQRQIRKVSATRRGGM